MTKNQHTKSSKSPKITNKSNKKPIKFIKKTEAVHILLQKCEKKEICTLSLLYSQVPCVCAAISFLNCIYLIYSLFSILLQKRSWCNVWYGIHIDEYVFMYVRAVCLCVVSKQVTLKVNDPVVKFSQFGMFSSYFLFADAVPVWLESLTCNLHSAHHHHSSLAQYTHIQRSLGTSKRTAFM